MEAIERLLSENPVLAKAVALEVVARRRRQLLGELRRIEERIREFESKHGASIEEYDRTMGDSFEAHEVWFEWKALVEVRKSVEEKLKGLERTLRKLTGKV